MEAVTYWKCCLSESLDVRSGSMLEISSVSDVCDTPYNSQLYYTFIMNV